MGIPTTILQCPDCGDTQDTQEAFDAILCPACGSDVPPRVYERVYPA